MSAPTPSPWIAESKSGSLWEVKHGMACVAQKCDEADARLIACAPELLAALERAEKLIADLNYAFYVGGKSKDLMPVMARTKPELAEIRAAISKAKGTTP